MTGSDRWDAVGRLEARFEVEQLLARYTALGDAGRIDEFADLFAPDGVLEIAGRRRNVGPAAVRAFVEESGARMRALPGMLPGAHHISSRLVEMVSSDEARSSSVFLFVGVSGPDHWGSYRDVLVHGGDGWRFARRSVRFSGFAAESRVAELIERLVDTVSPI